MNKKRLTIKLNTLMLAVLTLIFVYTSSTFLRSVYSFYIAVAAYIGFFIISVSIGQKWRINKTYMWAALALLACPIYILNGSGYRVTTYLSGIIYLFFWCNVFFFLTDNYDKKTIKIFALCNVGILITNVITTISVLEIYPLAARAINGKAEGITDRDIAIYTDMGCGGFGFIYGMVFMSLGLAAAFRSKNASLKIKLLSLAVYILVFNMVLMAEFTTALLLTVIMLLFALIMNRRKNGLNMVVLAILCCCIVGFGDYILLGLKTLAQSTGIDYLAEKMNMLIGASDNDSMDNLLRTQKYMESLKGFATNPVIGTGRSGGHSQILDTFSAVGLFAIPYFMLLISAFKTMGRYIENKYVLIFSVGVLILSSVNPFVDSTIISLAYMMTPTLLYCFAAKENNTTMNIN